MGATAHGDVAESFCRDRGLSCGKTNGFPCKRVRKACTVLVFHVLRWRFELCQNRSSGFQCKRVRGSGSVHVKGLGFLNLSKVHLPNHRFL